MILLKEMSEENQECCCYRTAPASCHPYVQCTCYFKQAIQRAKHSMFSSTKARVAFSTSHRTTPARVRQPTLPGCFRSSSSLWNRRPSAAVTPPRSGDWSLKFALPHRDPAGLLAVQESSDFQIYIPRSLALDRDLHSSRR